MRVRARMYVRVQPQMGLSDGKSATNAGAWVCLEYTLPAPVVVDVEADHFTLYLCVDILNVH